MPSEQRDDSRAIVMPKQALDQKKALKTFDSDPLRPMLRMLSSLCIRRYSPKCRGPTESMLIAYFHDDVESR
ncbi:hypothetical protein PGT21_017202 [Puccinia graminis f. sp. tritici]|uniref:Uncharacterized protein n=1 Tax=Puccinia graminis f. sp. tritici TaxID=56615 RepID=A0A5B0P6P5_PUCGR|nr:hypothetical protein PGT21_017202 [Puccinia graminis f. sp. tritici]